MILPPSSFEYLLGETKVYFSILKKYYFLLRELQKSKNIQKGRRKYNGRKTAGIYGISFIFILIKILIGKIISFISFYIYKKITYEICRIKFCPCPRKLQITRELVSSLINYIKFEDYKVAHQNTYVNPVMQFY